MFYSHWKGLIFQSSVGWLLPLEHLWVQASSHQGVAHIIYISLKHAVRHHWFLSKPGVSMMQAHGWGGAVDASPIRSCQELSEDRIQTHGQERPGQPAVTSLTLAETIHLAERGPPWVEKLTRSQTTCTRRQECAHTSRRVSCAQR